MLRPPAAPGNVASIRRPRPLYQGAAPLRGVSLLSRVAGRQADFDKRSQDGLGGDEIGIAGVTT